MKQHINFRGFWSMLALMFGFTIFSASVMTGAQLSQNLPIWQVILAIIIGNIFLAFYGGLMAWVANKRKHNLDGVLKQSFGQKGAVVPSMIMVLTQTGWFGVGVAMIAIPLADYAHISPWVFVFIIGLLIISTAFFGLKSLTIISIIAVPLVIILGFTTIILAATNGEVQQSNPLSLQVSMLGAISLVIGTFISGATFVPNFAVNGKNPKIALWTTVLAFFVGNGLMVSFGFVGQLFSDVQVVSFTSITQNLASNLTSGTFLIVIGLLILILNIWTTNDSGLYSISLGLSHWIKVPYYKSEKMQDGEDQALNSKKIVWISIPKRIWVVIFGLIGSASSLWIYENFLNFLNAMNQFVPPIGAIVIVNYYLRKQESALNYYGFNFETLITFLIATGISFVPILVPHASLVSFGLATLIYSIYILIEQQYFPRTKLDLKRLNYDHTF